MRASRVFIGWFGSCRLGAFAGGIVLAVFVAGAGSAAAQDDPAITVDPPSLSVDVAAGQTLIENLDIANAGGGVLDWNVTDTDPTGFRRVGAIDLGDGAGVFKSAIIDASGHYAYFGTTVPGAIFKIDLETGQPAGSLALPAGEIQLLSAVIDPAGAYGYFAMNAAPAQLIKIDLATLDQVGTAALDANVRSAVIDPSGAFAYLGTNTSPGRVLKVDLATLQQVATITLDTGENKLDSAVIDPAGRFAYFGTATAPGQVVKIDLSDFTLVGSLPLEDGEDTLQSAVIDPAGAFAYFGTFTVPGELVKIDLASFTRVGAAPAGPDEGFFTVGVIDPTGTAAYFSTSDAPATIVKFDLAGFERASAIAFADGENFVGAGVMDPGGNDAYFPATTDPGTLAAHVVKVGLVGQDCTLPPWASIDPTSGSLAVGESQNAGVTFDASGQSAGNYVATVCIASNDPAQPLVAVPLAMSVTDGDAPAITVDPPFLAATLDEGDSTTEQLSVSNLGGTALDWSVTETAPPTLARVGALPFASGEDFPRSVVTDSSGRYAWFGTFTTPGRIVKVDLSNYQRLASVTLAAGDDRLISGVRDPSGQFAYFGTSTSPGRIVKIDLATLGEVGSIALGDGEDVPSAAVMAPDGAFAYFATATDPGRIVKIDLSTFQRAGAITLADGEDEPLSAVVDPAGAHAWFGTSAGQVVEIDLASFTRARATTLSDDTIATAAIDAGGSTAWFGGFAGVTRVDLESLQPTGMALLADDEYGLLSGVIDADGAFGYFGTSAFPGQVVKIDLSMMVRVDGIALDDGEELLRTAAIDPAGHYVYFGATSFPGTPVTELVKVALAGPDCALPPWAGVAPKGGSVPPGGNDSVDVTFDATGEDPGDYSATLCIASNDPVRPIVTVPLQLSVASTTAAPMLSFTPTSLDFGDVQVGETSAAMTATLHNTGNASATALAFGNLAGSGFAAATGSCGSVLSAGSSCVVAVTFAPNNVGPASATLTVDSAEGASASLDLDGNGIPPIPPAAISVTPGSLAATLEPDQMQMLDLTIANLGGEQLDWQIDPLPGFRRVDRIDLAHANYVTAAAIDPSGRYAYFGGSNDNRGDVISKVDLATFEEVGDIDADGFDVGYTSAVVDPAGHYAYFGTYTDPGVIVKIDLDTFTQVDSITLGANEYFLDAAVIDPAGQYAYFFGYSSGKIIKIDLDAFAVVDTLTLSAPLSHPISAVINHDGNYAYFAIFPRADEPGQFVRLDLATFQLAGSVVMTTNERPTSSVIDALGKYAYLGTFGDENGNGQVVKIDVNAMAEVDEITLDAGEADLTSAVIDPSGTFAYFGANTQPGRIVRVDLATFARSGAVTLEAAGVGDLYGEDYPQSAVIDPSGEFAYFGLATFPGRVARMHLSGPDCTIPPWLSIDPTSGSVGVGGSDTASVGIDATGLAPGEYEATLCFDSNDPTRPQLPLPVSVTVLPVAPPDRIFADGFDAGTEEMTQQNAARR